MPFTHTSHKVAIHAACKHVFTRDRQSEYTSSRENVCRPARAPRFRTPPMPARATHARTNRCEFSNRHILRAPRCFHFYGARLFSPHSLAAASTPRRLPPRLNHNLLPLGTTTIACRGFPRPFATNQPRFTPSASVLASLPSSHLSHIPNPKSPVPTPPSHKKIKGGQTNSVQMYKYLLLSRSK